MEIKNKFEMGSSVFYPSADLSNPSIIESTVIGVSYFKDDKEELVSYRTEHSYGVREEHLSNDAKGAKKTLVKLMEGKRNEFLDKFNGAIKATKEMTPKELLNRLPNETTDPDGEI